MKKSILNLKGAQELTKSEQKTVNGGRRHCSSGCTIENPCCPDGYCKDLITKHCGFIEG